MSVEKNFIKATLRQKSLEKQKMIKKLNLWLEPLFYQKVM